MKKFILSLVCTFMIFASVSPVQAQVSLDALNDVIANVNTLDEEKYSDETFGLLEDKVKAAKSLSAPTQQDIDDAVAAILEAVNNLAPRYPNLALNKTVSVSSAYNNTKFKAANATDGDMSTRWGNNYNSSSYKGGNHEETITVDLGTKQSVDTLIVKWESSYATSYTIMGSNDGTNFFAIKDITKNTKGTDVIDNLGDVSVRYIRLSLHKASSKYGYSIWELEAYEKSPYNTIYHNMAYDASISVSSTYNSSKFALKHINDGDLSTRWGTDYSVTRENEYVIADLGKVCAVDRVKINFEDAYATKYKIQGSTDGKTYTDLTGELTGAIGEQFISNLNANVRYIKLSFIEAATEYGYSIYELGIYCPRQYELNVSLDALEEKLNHISIGTTDGTMSQKDYDKYADILSKGQAVVNNANSTNLEIYKALVNTNKALSRIDGDVISGVASVIIYPKPQSMTAYSFNGFKFDGSVDIVVHGKQDKATLPKLEALLEKHEISYQYADSVTTDAAIVLATQCGDESCTYCNNDDEALNQKQGYILESSNEENEKGQITIVGADEDGTYYGVMSMYQLFEQKTTDGRLAEVYVSDYPDVEFRGYVEGFYGIPWTFDDRARLFEDTTLYKMTTYIYAPKDDPYHRKSWRVLYPEAEANNIRDLAKVAADNNMDFCWTIHPGADYDYTTDADSDGIVDDYEIIIEKFEQVYSLGVRQFGIFYDDLDYDVANGIQHSTVLNDAYEYLTSKYDDVKPFITVVTRYTNSWGAPWDTYFTPFMKNIHEDTIVLWTGQSTMSAITKDYMEYPKNKTGVDRDLGVWWNFPVTDYYYGHLLMGSLDCLSSDVDNINSFFLNPMSEADASKVAIYSGADYAWNTAEFNSEESWKRAIKELVPGYNEEFERFADNLAHVTKGNGFYFDESKYLAPILEEFNTAFANGLELDDVTVLKAKFEQMVSDAKALRNVKNKDLYNEIKEFLNAYESLGQAGVNAMKAFEYALSGDINNTIDSINGLKNKLEESKTFKIKKLSGTAKVVVGMLRITPFLEDIEDKIMNVLNEHVSRSLQARMLTNVWGLDVQKVEANTYSYTLKDIEANMKKDDYITIALPKVMLVNTIKANINHPDNFKLQYSINGIDWVDLENEKTDSMIYSKELVMGAYARLLCLNDCEAIIETLNVTEAYEAIIPNISTNLPTYQTYTLNKALDGSLTTHFWSSTGSNEQSYICVDLGDKAHINSIELYSGINKHGTVDGFDGTILEVSDDGVIFSQVGEVKALDEYEDVDSKMKKLVFNTDVYGRYFRFRPAKASESWAKVYDIQYNADYLNYENKLDLTTNMTVYQTYSMDKAMDNSLGTYAWLYSKGYYSDDDRRGTVVGDYVQVDLGTIVPLYDASIYFGKNAKQPQYIADAFKGLKLQTSIDGETWTDVGEEVLIENYSAYDEWYIASVKGKGELARYLRFSATLDYASWIKVYEIKYNQTTNSKPTNNISTNMKTYEDYIITNAMDKKLESKFYSSAASKVGDYIQVDLGSSINLFDLSIYFGGDPNKANAIDGYKAMNIQVSEDGKNWTTVKSMKSSEYKVVGGKYLATTTLEDVSGRYFRFIATEASSSWIQVFEIQYNNTIDSNILKFADNLGTVKVNFTNHIDDQKLETYTNFFEVNDGDTFIYPTNTVTHVSNIGILQDSGSISNAKVSVLDMSGEWKEIGTLDDTWNEFDVSDKIKQIKITFNNVPTQVSEIFINGYADYFRVDKAIAAIPADLSKYKEESVKALEDVVDAVIYNLDVNEQDQVEHSAYLIEKAIDALELNIVLADYTNVENALNNVPQDLSNYTDESVQALNDAIDAIVYDLDSSKQDEVNAMADAINAAINALVFKDADYTDVDNALNNVPQDLSNYTDESVQALNDAINAVVRGLNITEQTRVNEFAQNIINAIEALIYKRADYTKVEEAVERIPADLSNYTDESVQALNDVIDAIVYDLDITKQAEVNAMADAINAAIDALVYKDADYTDVDNAINSKPADLTLYIEETVEVLLNAINAVVRGLNITEQALVNEFAQNIINAIEALIYKRADYTKVEEAVERIPADLSIYTDESVQALSDALNTLVEDLDITKQAEVNAMADAINAAIDALAVNAADYSAVDAAIQRAEAIDQQYIRDFSAVTAAINAVVRDLDMTKQDEVDGYAKAIEDAIDALKVGKIIEIERMEATAGDAQPGEGADKAIDNDVNTMWHTDWYGSERDKHYFIVTLDELTNINGLRILNRQNHQHNGSIAKFDLYVRVADDAEWELIVDDGELDKTSKEWQTVDFDETDALQVKLVVLDSAEDPNQASLLFASIAEFRLYATGKEVEPVADYAAVNAAIEAADRLNKDLYTNFEVVEEAIEAVVRGLRVSAQDEVNAMADAINDAVAALVLKPADYSKLEEAIEEAEALNAADYKDFSKVLAAVAAGKAVADDLDISEQSIIDEAVKAITNAVNALQLKDADYSAVEEAIETIPADLTIYTDESLEALEDALDAVVEGLDFTKQPEVDAMAAAINAAVEALTVKDADYSAVEEAIATIPEVLDIYTVESLEALEAALDTVVEGLDITKQAEVDAMAAAIAEAVAGLELLPADYSEVEAAIEAASKLNKDNYKDFDSVEEAVAAVVEGLDITKQDEVDAMAQAIIEAIQGLEAKPAEPQPPVEPDPDQPEPDQPGEEGEDDEDVVVPEQPEDDDNVNTSDNTQVFGFFAMLLAAAFVFMASRKRKED